MNTPDMMPGTVEQVSVEWLLANLTGFVDLHPGEADWVQMMNDKAYDSATSRLVDRIFDEGFTVPICLYDAGYGGWALGNGHHRMTAAILTCSDNILVYWSENSDYMHSESTTKDETDWWSEQPNDFAQGVSEILNQWQLFA